MVYYMNNTNIEDYNKYLKYKKKYLNLKIKLQNNVPVIPNPITNISAVKITAPTIPNPVSNTSVVNHNKRK